MLNKKVIINALKNLQDKIKNLESNANKTSTILPESNIYSAYPVNTDNEDTIIDDYHKYDYLNNRHVNEDEKSSNTEKRITELEKQLAKMRSLLIEDKIESNDDNNFDDDSLQFFEDGDYAPKNKHKVT